MGRVTVVGIGPGDPGQMTIEARDALLSADVIVGYRLYTDLIRDLVPGKKILSGGMTQEEERCREALAAADAGKNAALISSGDAGVYGLAGLCIELSGEYPGAEVKVLPGVSAVLSGAALLGAPLVNDFAVISLSDLLTPRGQIERRLLLAAEADFVICLYNPGSRRRTDGLRRACGLIRRFRPEETVCGIVRQIGRSGQEKRILTLGELREVVPDMLMTVWIGCSRTRIVSGRMVTERGYRCERAEAPEEDGRAEQKEKAEEVFLPDPDHDRVISLIGMGPGEVSLLTERAVRAIQGADALFGSERMLDAAAAVLGRKAFSKKLCASSYRQEEVFRIVREHPEVRRAAVLFSGDLSLYSGAALWKGREKTAAAGDETQNSAEAWTTDTAGADPAETEPAGRTFPAVRLERIPGISSVSFFLQKTGRSGKNLEILSAHGREIEAAGLILHRSAVLVLLGDNDFFPRTLRELSEADAGGIRVTLAEQLSYPGEKITEGTVSSFLQTGVRPADPALLLFENPAPLPEVPGFFEEDHQFLRGEKPVPMTKEEIRALSLSMLSLRRGSILYDIGAGTGSCSIAAAAFLERGRVYAFERNPDALRLIRENKRKLHAANVEIVPGEFPEHSVSAVLPAPDAAFVGGSGGRLRQILGALREKNPDVTIVINSVTLETAAETAGLRDLFPAQDGWEMHTRAVQATRFLPVGSYHLARPESPVQITLIRKKRGGPDVRKESGRSGAENHVL